MQESRVMKKTFKGLCKSNQISLCSSWDKNRIEFIFLGPGLGIVLRLIASVT